MATKKQLAALKRGREIRAANLRAETRGKGSPKTKPAAKKKASTTNSSKDTTVAKKKSSGGKKSGKSKGGGKKGTRAGFTNKDAMIALGVVAGYGHLQASAQEQLAKDKNAKPLLTQVPMVSAVGRAGTLCAIAYAGHRFMKIPWLKPVAFGLAGVTALTFARRGFKTFDESDATDKAALLLSGAGDEMALPSAQVSVAGELTIDGDEDALSVALRQLQAAA